MLVKSMTEETRAYSNFHLDSSQKPCSHRWFSLLPTYVDIRYVTVVPTFKGLEHYITLRGIPEFRFPVEMAQKTLRRGGSAPSSEVYLEIPTSSPEVITFDKALVSLVKDSQSTELQVSKPHQMTDAVKHSASQLSRMAIRLAARLSVNERQINSHAEALSRARMSQYKTQRKRLAEIHELESMVREKDQKVLELTENLANAATPLRDASSSLSQRTGFISPPLSPESKSNANFTESPAKEEQDGKDDLEPGLLKVDTTSHGFEESQDRLRYLEHSETQLKKLVDDYQQVLHRLEESQVDLLRKLESSNSEKQELLASQSGLQQKLMDEQDRNHGLDSETEEARGKIWNLEQASTRMQEYLIMVNKRVELMEKSNRKLTRELTIACHRESALALRLEMVQTTKNNVEQKFRESLDSLENLENEVRSLTVMNGRLAQDLQSQIAKETDIEKLYDSVQTTIEELKSEKSCLDEELRAMEEHGRLKNSENSAEMESIIQQASAAEEHLTSALNQAEMIGEELSKNQQEIQRLNAEQEETRKQLGISQLKLSIADDENENHLSNLTALRSHQADLEQNLETLKEDNSNLQRKLEGSKSELEHVQQEAQGLAAALEASKKTISELEQKIRKVERSEAKVRVQLRRVQSQNKSINAKLRLLTTHLRSMSREKTLLLSELSIKETELSHSTSENRRLGKVLEDAKSNLTAVELTTAKWEKQYEEYVVESNETLKRSEESRRASEADKIQTENRLKEQERHIEGAAVAYAKLRNVIDRLAFDIARISKKKSASRLNLASRSNILRRVKKDESAEFEFSTELFEAQLVKLHHSKNLLDSTIASLIAGTGNTTDRGYDIGRASSSDTPLPTSKDSNSQPQSGPPSDCQDEQLTKNFSRPRRQTSKLCLAPEQDLESSSAESNGNGERDTMSFGCIQSATPLIVSQPEARNTLFRQGSRGQIITLPSRDGETVDYSTLEIPPFSTESEESSIQETAAKEVDEYSLDHPPTEPYDREQHEEYQIDKSQSPKEAEDASDHLSIELAAPSSGFKDYELMSRGRRRQLAMNLVPPYQWSHEAPPKLNPLEQEKNWSRTPSQDTLQILKEITDGFAEKTTAREMTPRPSWDTSNLTYESSLSSDNPLETPAIETKESERHDNQRQYHERHDVLEQHLQENSESAVMRLLGPTLGTDLSHTSPTSDFKTKSMSSPTSTGFKEYDFAYSPHSERFTQPRRLPNSFGAISAIKNPGPLPKNMKKKKSISSLFSRSPKSDNGTSLTGNKELESKDSGRNGWFKAAYRGMVPRSKIRH